MHKNKTIKGFLSGLLLCVFTFSITPKQWLHDIIANHKDSYAHSVDGKTQVSKAGFHCNCDDLVVSSPYLDSINPLELTISEFFPSYNTNAVNNFHSTQLFFIELRGPPVFL